MKTKIGILATTAIMSVASVANAEQFRKYEPQVEVGAKFGNKRNIGLTKLMIPALPQCFV